MENMEKQKITGMKFFTNFNKNKIETYEKFQTELKRQGYESFISSTATDMNGTIISSLSSFYSNSELSWNFLYSELKKIEKEEFMNSLDTYLENSFFRDIRICKFYFKFNKNEISKIADVLTKSNLKENEDLGLKLKEKYLTGNFQLNSKKEYIFTEFKNQIIVKYVEGE